MCCSQSDETKNSRGLRCGLAWVEARQEKKYSVQPSKLSLQYVNSNRASQYEVTSATRANLTGPRVFQPATLAQPTARWLALVPIDLHLILSAACS
jgi:hypothetical protein